MQTGQQWKLGGTVHESLEQPEHRSRRRLREDVRELLVCCDMLEVNESEGKGVSDEV